MRVTKPTRTHRHIQKKKKNDYCCLYCFSPLRAKTASFAGFGESFKARGANAAKTLVQLILRDNQRRRKTQSVIVGDLGENSVLHHRLGEHFSAGAVVDVAVDLNRTPQTAGTDLLDEDELLVEGLEAGGKLLADLGGVRDDLLILDDLEDLLADGARDGVAAEGGAVGAGSQDVHDFVVGHHGGDRDDAAAERLGEAGDVGADAFVLLSEQLARAPHAGLDFVADQQNVVLGAEPAGFFEVAFGRDDDAGLALDGLDEEAAHELAELFENVAELDLVAELDDLEAGENRAEHLAVLDLIGDGNGGHAAPVEVARARDDDRLAEGDVFFGVAPSADEFDGGLDRLGARVHEKDLLVVGRLAKIAREVAELVVVEGAGAQSQAVELLLGGGDDAGVTVAEVDGAVAGEEVEVSVAFGVPDVDALASGDDDGHGGVVVSGVEIVGAHEGGGFGTGRSNEGIGGKELGSGTKHFYFYFF